MRSTFSILFYINRNRIKADGTTAVMCRITIDGKNTVMTTGICCKPEDWNAKSGTVRTVRENNRLQEYRKYIEQCYEDILKTQGVVSAEIIKNRITRQFIVPTHLLQMGEIERERLRIRSKEINSISTYLSVAKVIMELVKDNCTYVSLSAPVITVTFPQDSF